MKIGLNYFDIETTGLDPRKDKLITAQWQDLVGGGKMQFLKEWESSEEEVVHAFDEATGFSRSKWSFIPVGTNLNFEFKWLWTKFVKYGILDPLDDPYMNWADRPTIDLQPIFVMMNHGEFKGASLDKFSAKQTSGTLIPKYYKERNFAAISNYVEKETAAAVDVFHALALHSPIWWRDVIAPAIGADKPKGVVLP